MALLELQDLHVEVKGIEILKGINLKVERGEISALMGPNGAGKSTLGYALMGHPDYAVTKGTMLFNGEDIATLKPHRRAQKGMFLSFQYPSGVPGLSIPNFLKTAYGAVKNQNIAAPQFLKLLREKMQLLKMDESFLKRHLNEGFSGGEKKRMEILQLAVLQPQLAVLDETDSGLDIDALKAVANGINIIRAGKKDMGILLITHYQRILRHLKPNTVHVMMQGRIVKSGGHELAEQIEKSGYETVVAGKKENEVRN